MNSDEKMRALSDELLFELDKIEQPQRRLAFYVKMNRTFFVEGVKWAFGPAFGAGLVLGAAIGAWVTK